MANAARDENRIPTLIGISSSDGTTPTLAEIDPNTGELLVKTSPIQPNYDYIDLTYTGNDLTEIVYKTGGSGGVTQSTWTLAYTGDVLNTITKT